MTLAIAQPAPSLGDIVYLCSCAIQLGVEAVTTFPDTPNQYSASLKVMGDLGNMNLDAVRGRKGPDGQAVFALRDAVKKMGYDPISTPSDLPQLPNDEQHVGIYWLIDELDDQGHLLSQWCYVWWGTYYRQIMMGTIGPPGPVPDISLITTPIPPDQKPAINVSGPTLDPIWEFLYPAPQGTPGPVGPLYGFPDVDEVTVAPAPFNVLSYNGSHWVPFNVESLIPKCYSMPSSAFTSYTGVSQQAAIGSFTVPAQPWPWTPLVWGHIGATGAQLSANPFMIGCQVLLDDAVTGKQIARGLGSTLGAVNIMPHYSSASNRNTNITPRNRTALIPANTGATLYINLWNDGQLGEYFFNPTDAQLFVMAMPMLREETTS